MSTLSEVKQQRKDFDGRDTYERFAQYCTYSDLAPTEEVLADWDARLNNFRIRDNFGNRDDIYVLGLRTLYQRFLTNNCLRIPNGEVITLPTGVTYQPTIRERRVVGDTVSHLRDVTTKQMNVIRDQFRVELRQLLRTQKFFNLPAGEIREIVNEELDNAIGEKPQIAAD